MTVHLPAVVAGQPPEVAHENMDQVPEARARRRMVDISPRTEEESLLALASGKDPKVVTLENKVLRSRAPLTQLLIRRRNGTRRTSPLCSTLTDASIRRVSRTFKLCTRMTV